ncbi:hypothetical protein Dalu01_01452 [Deinococcus aluminii]|uniref:Tyr recombinase domain-containing protein n=1 Tax=Deinococcus aluminii TaxID=1656885 RepID=A0ABP9XCF6_9DEIO
MGGVPSLAALRGVRAEVLSRLLGHSSPAFTLTQYHHLYPEELAPVSLGLPPVPEDEAEAGSGEPVPEVAIKKGRKGKRLET